MENIRKSLYDLSWQGVTEEEYHNDPTLSYSNLSHYERGGFEAVKTLRDKKESPSLLFGSLVDTLLTDGPEEYNNRFMVAEFPAISDVVVLIVKELFNVFHDKYNNLCEITDREMIVSICQHGYQSNWKDTTRCNKIREVGSEYYKLLYLSQNKTIISRELHQSAIQAVDVLKNSEATKWYFQQNNPFENIVRYYQLKFKAILPKYNIEYKVMFDELIIDYDNKTIQPVDLKTSCVNGGEWTFPEHFIQWNYQLQCRLYVRVLKQIISKDEYFKDFTILPYKDIIIYKGNLDPLIWDFDDTFKEGTLIYGKNNQFICRDPEEIGNELNYYLSSGPKRPIGVKNENNLVEFLNKI